MSGALPADCRNRCEEGRGLLLQTLSTNVAVAIGPNDECEAVQYLAVFLRWS